MTRSSRRRTALAAIGVLVAAGLTVAPTGPAHAQTACSVDYQIAWDNGGGFGANVTLTNHGDPVSGWQLTFTFPGTQQVTHGWVAVWSQSGPDVTAGNESWNANLGTGAVLTAGFNGSYTGSNQNPTEFFLNGVACTGPGGGNQPPEVEITSPADGASFTAPADIPVTATASDPDGSVDRVEFYRNGALVGTDPTAPYSFTHTGLPAGSYLLLARAFDDQDAFTDDQVTVTVEPSTVPAVVTTLNTVSVVEGGTGSFGVSLSQQPAGNVTVSTARTSGSTGITVTGGATLTFTTGNWDDPQPVTVAAADGSAGQSAELTSTAAGHTAATVTVNSLDAGGEDPVWVQRFLEQYDNVKNSGYFSSHGIPYHSIEELIVEAPDYGHLTTSEALSYWLWMEANFGRVTENWTPFNQAWQVMETFIIPGTADQPSAGAAGDAIYAAEHPQPSGYPSPLDSGVPVGQDPLRGELQSTYGTGEIYGMHWLLDVDNAYGYGFCGDGTTSPAYINTFQRGEQESVWETVPHPSCETFDAGGPNGFLDLFISDPGGAATQWRYTNAPDADARAVQAAYWALTWAREQGNEAQVAGVLSDAARMGDYLRYAMFDKYFKQVGNCVGPNTCPGASGRGAAHYLLSWYYAWGGSYPASEWSWRIGSSHNHFGYQNPVAAWALSTVPELVPDAPTAQADWADSLDRQLEFYQWLQSAEGGIAGGATNSWGGDYGTPPAGSPTFYGMFYDDCPVYHDPCSNEWFGFQVWSLQRVAEYLFLTGDPRAEQILDNWVPWAIGETTVGPGAGDYQVPSTMEWTGAPETWNPTSPQPNDDLHVTVVEHGQDVGVAAAYARTLMWYAAATGDSAAQQTALGLLEALYENMGPAGITVPEERADYDRFLDEVFIPAGWSGTMGNGEQIAPGVTFFGLRESLYAGDPNIDEVLAYANGTGPAPTFEYHRSWAQMDIANAFADYAHLFPSG
jgi:hypothetical protein